MSSRRLLASIASASLVLSAVTAAVAASPPAYADGGANCSGQSCSINLAQYIQLGGDVGGPGIGPGTSISVPPPPCWYVPYLDGQDMYKTATGLGDFQQFMPEIKKDRYAAGLWYIRNTYVNCPLTEAVFVPPGGLPPPPPIPPSTLAAFAYNQMRMPVPQLTLNPVRRSVVNLPTYVWAHWPADPATGSMTTKKITASLKQGNESVTVWAQAGNLNVNASSPGIAYSAGCGPTGSRYPVGRPPAAGSGPGAKPDCGVVYQGTSTGSPLSVTLTWSTSWGSGDFNGPGPNALAPITVTGPNPPQAEPVAEIQNLNG
jgi:hypothetical protein